MEAVKLIEKKIIKPEQETERRRIFLSRLDIALVSYQESAQFFDPPPNHITFSDSYTTLYRALSRLLVPYDFFAGRLAPSLEDSSRLEIDCNGAGILVAVARTETKLAELGEILARKPDYNQLVAFLHDERQNEAHLHLHNKPLLHIQLTEFGCGSLALASSYNHCVLDGLSVHEFEINLAALTKDIKAALKQQPNPDRTIFKAREPPKISYPHHEYSKPTSNSSSAISGPSTPFNTFYSEYRNTHMVYISRDRISAFKKAALQDGLLKSCTTFQAVSARLWKARTVALRMSDDAISTLLFPVDARRIVRPAVPAGFAGNAVVPGFARVSVKELKKEGSDSLLVKKIQQGLQLLDDEYVRSSIDWLEVHRGSPNWENSFSVAQWFRLALEETYSWGTAKCAVPIGAKPGLVVLLSGPKSQGGLSVCLELQDDQLLEFNRVLLMDSN
ncbi:Acyltransferase GLAUCE [Linum grandiflorum]